MSATRPQILPKPPSATEPAAPTPVLAITRASNAVRVMIFQLLAALSFRFVCFAFMIFLALMNEARPAPSLPDLLVDSMPYVGWLNRWNYAIWLLSYFIPGVILIALAPKRAKRLMISGGILAAVRGLCIPLTGLGPVNQLDTNAGMSLSERLTAFYNMMDPVTVLAQDIPGTYLTKDLFFSGHVATTFLLLLYVWPIRWLRYFTLALHFVVLSTVFLGHMHYTIDVIGAYAITFSLFIIREKSVRDGLSPDALGPTWSQLKHAQS